jgi:hypothetical protein
MGYNLIRGIFPFSAEILLYHHMFQLHTYPEIMPSASIPYSPKTDGSILDLTREGLAVVDAYDALHRPHYDTEGKPFFLNDQTIRDKMAMIHHNRLITVVYLYEKGIFDNADKVKPATADAQLH